LSRGYGKLQWRLLTLLSAHERKALRSRRQGLDTLTLAQRIHGREPTRSEVVSIRRALTALMRDDAVSHLGLRYGHRHHWRAPRRQKKAPVSRSL
jgi:hypothetical protein